MPISVRVISFPKISVFERPQSFLRRQPAVRWATSGVFCFQLYIVSLRFIEPDDHSLNKIAHWPCFHSQHSSLELNVVHDMACEVGTGWVRFHENIDNALGTTFVGDFRSEKQTLFLPFSGLFQGLSRVSSSSLFLLWAASAPFFFLLKPQFFSSVFHSELFPNFFRSHYGLLTNPFLGLFHLVFFSCQFFLQVDDFLFALIQFVLLLNQTVIEKRYTLFLGAMNPISRPSFRLKRVSSQLWPNFSPNRQFSRLYPW